MPILIVALLSSTAAAPPDSAPDTLPPASGTEKPVKGLHLHAPDAEVPL